MSVSNETYFQVLETVPEPVNRTEQQEMPVQLLETKVPDRATTLEEEKHFVDLSGNIQIDVASMVEPRGLDLATDMTSSFIDPSTMGTDVDEPTQGEVK